MRKLIVLILITTLGCCVCYAQGSFSSDLLNGDVKMEEGFLMMAKRYYSNALEKASTPEEMSIVQRKLSRCNNAIEELNRLEKEKQEANNISQKLYSGYYIEARPSVSDNSSPGAVHKYFIEIYDNRLVIKSHEIVSVITDTNYLKPGTVLPLIDKRKSNRIYSNTEEGVAFLAVNNYILNDSGKKISVHKLFRLEDDAEIELYGEWEEKYKSYQLISMAEDSTSVAPAIPLEFGEPWVLNLDEDNVKLSDTRDEVLFASDIRWLVLNIPYTNPLDTSIDLSLIIVVKDPSGVILAIGEEDYGDYSFKKEWSFLPSEGILNIIIGADDPGQFTSGEYVFEVRTGEHLLYSCSFNFL